MNYAKRCSLDMMHFFDIVRTKIYIGNLDLLVTEEEPSQIFLLCGTSTKEAIQSMHGSYPYWSTCSPPFLDKSVTSKQAMKRNLFTRNLPTRIMLIGLHHQGCQRKVSATAKRYLDLGDEEKRALYDQIGYVDDVCCRSKRESDDLYTIISQWQSERKGRLDAMFASLVCKYGGDEPSSEPTDEEFEAAREKLKKRKGFKKSK
ncbi:hypothetical protein Ccrd_001098 [Cynara cardunculus var. scolymus]|uniref:DnaJ domain-containing protein n=1 Tax=Cynara cardunculus var. scolymus TaxID=59895 RepID=A0A103XU05_CYNCS|nr:hypothetical protein Ccrd_001098 [Cynara cardunculus var. scolymus]